MTPRPSRAVLVVAASLALSACNLAFSLDDYAAPALEPCSTCAAERCQCAPKAPTGFDHARLRVAPKAGEVCPSGTVAGVAMGKGVEDTGCACGCDSPAPGAACGLAVFAGKGCQGAPSSLLTASSCTALGVSGDSSVAVLPAAGASCPAKALANAPEFEVRVLACLDQLPSESGCDERTTCAAAADAPFDPSPCIVAKPGAKVECPDSYSHEYSFATGFDDQRSCSASGCACSPQECPDTKVTLCQDAACQSSCGLSAQSFGNCKDFAGLTHGRVDFDGKTAGSCTPSGSSAASGSLTTTGSLVVCCRSALGA